jgi:hypothetical protein
MTNIFGEGVAMTSYARCDNWNWSMHFASVGETIDSVERLGFGIGVAGGFGNGSYVKSAETHFCPRTRVVQLGK